MKKPTGWSKKSISFIIFNIIFGVFITFLIITAVNGAFSPLFYNVLDQVDVSANYQLSYPIFRSIFEPFIGLHFALGLDFDNWLGLFMGSYLIWRILVLLFRVITRKDKSESIHVAIKNNATEFALKWGSLIFFVGIITLGLGFAIGGFLFVTNNYNWITRTMAWSWVSFFFGKIIHNLIIRKVQGKNEFPKKYFSKNRLLSKIQHRALQLGLLYTKQEILKFFQTFGLVLMLNQAILTVRLPTQQITTSLAEDEFLFDFHVHTILSDGSLTPVQRVKWYTDQGIQGAAFSDHHHPGGSIAAQDYVSKKNLDFTVLLSQEFTDDPENIHLNIWGIDEPLIPTDYDPLDRVENTMKCKEVIEWVKAQGGYVTVNHYRGNGGEPFTYEELRDWGVDGFEVINGGDERDPEIRQFCLDNNLICMAGSDDHTNGPLNTLVKLRLDDPSNKSLDAVFEALYRNEHETVLIQPYNSNVDIQNDGLESLVNYFLGIKPEQRISWFLWVSAFGIFINIIHIKNSMEKVKYK